MSRRPFAFALAGGFLALSSVAWAAEDNTITVYKVTLVRLLRAVGPRPSRLPATRSPFTIWKT